MVILRTGAEPWGTQGKASGWGGLGRFPRIDLINIKAVAEKKKGTATHAETNREKRIKHTDQWWLHPVQFFFHRNGKQFNVENGNYIAELHSWKKVYQKPTHLVGLIFFL